MQQLVHALRQLVERLGGVHGAAHRVGLAAGDAAAVGGGPRSSVAWSYSGLRPEAFFEAAAPRATAKAGKPKRQSRQHEKATKSKVKYGSRR